MQRRWGFGWVLDGIWWGEQEMETVPGGAVGGFSGGNRAGGGGVGVGARDEGANQAAGSTLTVRLSWHYTCTPAYSTDDDSYERFMSEAYGKVEIGGWRYVEDARSL
ncbi:hypothetical protein K458DRAFT_388032 [Lentithecium fluviatile CBS 122367]|uniref:Uncharacterized protein n=1 Tax=Lentithecium fluviatile CBS 122367 TaxID=1168545 RepID=A0A6G1J4T2_9PLEO|nr:hypothetical protein K458DRAFT_388032 [Lentithecium fluviatile CBS 122367]